MTTDFGRDTSCTTSIRSGRLVSGVRLVAESFYRRLTTPRGTLRGEEAERNFGLDLQELVGSVQTKADIAALPGRIESELRKDERAEEIAVDVVDVSTGIAKAFEVSVSATTSAGPFQFKLLATEVTVELLGMKVG